MDFTKILNLDKTIEITLFESYSYSKKVCDVGNYLHSKFDADIDNLIKIILFVRSREKYVLWNFGSFYNFGPKCKKIFEDNFMNGDSIYINFIQARDNQYLLSSLVDKRFDKISIEFNFIISEEDCLQILETVQRLAKSQINYSFRATIGEFVF